MKFLKSPVNLAPKAHFRSRKGSERIRKGRRRLWRAVSALALGKTREGLKVSRGQELCEAGDPPPLPGAEGGQDGITSIIINLP